MPNWNVSGYPFGIGALIALVVLVVCIILWIVGHTLSDHTILGLIGALAVARLIP